MGFLFSEIALPLDADWDTSVQLKKKRKKERTLNCIEHAFSSRYDSSRPSLISVCLTNDFILPRSSHLRTLEDASQHAGEKVAAVVQTTMALFTVLPHPRLAEQPYPQFYPSGREEPN
jgi:hypothetical protein